MLLKLMLSFTTRCKGRDARLARMETLLQGFNRLGPPTVAILPTEFQSTRP